MSGPILEPTAEPAAVPEDFGGAAQALLASLMEPEAPPVETPPAEVIPEGEVVPEVVPETPPAEEVSPSLDLTALDDIKNSIISEIQALRQEVPEGGDPTSPDDKGEQLIDNEQFMELFSENPVQAIVDLANGIADQKVQAQIIELSEKMKPILDKQEELAMQEKVKDTLAEFVGNPEFADAEKYFPQMVELINSQNLPKDSLETFANTYRQVALNDLKANTGRTLEDYLADDNEVGKITSNPKVRDAIIEQYLKEVATGKAPQVISSGGSTVATPPTTFDTISDAGKAFKQSL